MKTISAYPLQRAYSEKIILNTSKQAHLKTMIQKNLIPTEFQKFYENTIGENQV